MQRNILETVMGAVVLIVAAGFLFFFSRTTDIKPVSGYQLTADFSKIDGLETGSPVRISGVKVGQVLSFHLDPESYNAVVTMNIEDGIKLPKDTAAVVVSAGMLDGKFMSLEPGADEEMLTPGDKIAYTQSTPSLEQMLGQVIFSLNKDKTEDKPEPMAPESP
jgi:phospholipid/cholesterol/gamma-HCH transport system substrate-binding protein